ncbi:amino acid ABC transporter substrate-binding protein [Nocardioides agariphilus]|uniref:Amino acid ABC transporter substrate-binding protein n=1 Tax=Nocardioides agariphilus TaxID=433664 RepID=A0A930VQW7_9ACTN|nr:ABC transporter substrate-binding protein [Nocardioides agariphilus]MBF4769343.1 amino acid ABC transporter substrate-binding protein [Nocardioides agariphilus]
MKRYQMAVALAATVAVLTTGCGSGASSAQEKADGTTGGGTSADASESKDFGTIDDGVLSVVTNLSLEPYRYQEDGKMGGFEIELTEKIAKNLGFSSVTWANINWDSLITDVAAHKHDVAIAGINGWAEEGTPIYDVVMDRTKIVSFSTPYFLPYWALVTSKDNRPDLTNVDQLGDGDSVQLLDGTSEFFWAQENLAPKGVDVRAGKDVSADFVAVESGLVDATIEEGTSLHSALEAHPGLQEGDPIDGLSAGFGWAFAHETNALREAFNAELANLVADGEYAELYKKFFPWLEPPATLPDTSFTG